MRRVIQSVGGIFAKTETRETVEKAPALPEKSFANVRKEQRRRVRLASAKGLDRNGAWICDLAIVNESNSGFKLLLVNGKPPPRCFWLIDEHAKKRFSVEVIWCKDLNFGVRIVLN